MRLSGCLENKLPGKAAGKGGQSGCETVVHSKLPLAQTRPRETGSLVAAEKLPMSAAAH